MQAPAEEPKRRSYAFLHDFCMQIPYGGIVVLSGLVLGVKGPLAAGVLLSLTGMGVLMCARSSLKAWKAGRPSTYYTLMSTIATGYLTWIFGAHREASGAYTCITCSYATMHSITSIHSGKCMFEATDCTEPALKADAIDHEHECAVCSI